MDSYVKILKLLLIYVSLTKAVVVPTDFTNTETNETKLENFSNITAEERKSDSAEKWSSEEYSPAYMPKLDKNGKEIFGSKILHNTEPWKGIFVETTTEFTTPLSIVTPNPPTRTSVANVETIYPTHQLNVFPSTTSSYQVDTTTSKPIVLEKKVIVPVKVFVKVPVPVPQPYPVIKYVDASEEGQNKEQSPPEIEGHEGFSVKNYRYNHFPHNRFSYPNKRVLDEYRYKRRMENAYRRHLALRSKNKSLPEIYFQNRRFYGGNNIPRRTRDGFPHIGNYNGVTNHIKQYPIEQDLSHWKQNDIGQQYLYTTVIYPDPQTVKNFHAQNDASSADFEYLKATRMHNLNLNNYHPKIVGNNMLKSYWQVKQETSVPYPWRHFHRGHHQDFLGDIVYGAKTRNFPKYPKSAYDYTQNDFRQKWS